MIELQESGQILRNSDPAGGEEFRLSCRLRSFAGANDAHLSLPPTARDRNTGVPSALLRTGFSTAQRMVGPSAVSDEMTFLFSGICFLGEGIRVRLRSIPHPVAR